MDNCTKNREFVGTIGDLVESLYDEVSALPLSDAAKTALVMIMVGDILKCHGKTVYFNMPAHMNAAEVAA